MDQDRYRVAGPRVTVTTQVDPDHPGRAYQDFFRGQVLPADVPDEEIGRLLGGHEIELVDERSDAGANVAEGQAQTVDRDTGQVVGGNTPADDGWVVGESDPGDFDVPTVSRHLATADDAERDRILTAERGGKARKGVLGE